MSELGDLDIDLDEEGTHQSPNSPHGNKDGQVPDIVEHARPIERQAVSVQAKISVPAKMGRQDLSWVLLQKTQHNFCYRALIQAVCAAWCQV